MLLAIHIRDDVCRIPTRILYSYLKHNTPMPGVTSLVPTYGFDENSDNETLCAVCQEKPVTRVILPCRHACTCGMCFDMLNRKCPLCRTTIQSFFVTADEAKFATEEDSSEVNEEPRSWRRTFDELNHRYAMAMGLQENQWYNFSSANCQDNEIAFCSEQFLDINLLVLLSAQSNIFVFTPEDSCNIQSNISNI